MVGASILITQSIASTDLFQTILQWAIGHAKKPNESWADFLTSTDNRRKLLRYAWIAAVLVAVVISVIAIALSAWIGSTLKPGIVFVVFVWGALLGSTALISLSSKVLTTLFGGLIGVSLSDITTGFSGLLQKMTLGIADLANHIGTIAGQGNSGGPHFIEQMVWLFVGLVALCCLPAFFAD